MFSLHFRAEVSSHGCRWRFPTTATKTSSSAGLESSRLRIFRSRILLTFRILSCFPIRIRIFKFERIQFFTLCHSSCPLEFSNGIQGIRISSLQSPSAQARLELIWELVNLSRGWTNSGCAPGSLCILGEEDSHLRPLQQQLGVEASLWIKLQSRHSARYAKAQPGNSKVETDPLI